MPAAGANFFERFLADRPDPLLIPPSVSNFGGGRVGINTRNSPDPEMPEIAAFRSPRYYFPSEKNSDQKKVFSLEISWFTSKKVPPKY